MKKLLTLSLAFLVSFSIFGRPKENPKITDERISNFIIEEYREMGYTVFPEVIIQDTLKKSNYEKYWEEKNGKLESPKPEYDDLYYNPKIDKQSKKHAKQKIQEDTLYFKSERPIIIQIENDNYYTSHFSYGRFYYPYWFNPYWYDPFDMIYDPFISFNSHFYWSFGFGHSPYYPYYHNYTPWYNPYWYHPYYGYSAAYGHGGGGNHNYSNIPQQRRESSRITANHNGGQPQNQYAPVERRKLGPESRPAYHESRRTYSPSYNNPKMSVRPHYNNSKTERINYGNSQPRQVESNNGSQRRIEYSPKSYSGVGDVRRSYSSGSNQNSYNRGSNSSSDRRSYSGGSYSGGNSGGGMGQSSGGSRSSGSSNNSGGGSSSRR